MTPWEKNQRFSARVAHRIEMTEKINREAKNRHAAEMAAYEDGSEHIQAATNQRKKKTINKH
jgi:hypothetical protein